MCKFSKAISNLTDSDDVLEAAHSASQCQICNCRLMFDDLSVLSKVFDNRGLNLSSQSVIGSMLCGRQQIVQFAGVGVLDERLAYASYAGCCFDLSLQQ